MDEIIDAIIEPAAVTPAGDAPPSGATGAAPHHVFLIDGSGFIFRAYHALPPLSRSDGTQIGRAHV